MKFNCNCIYCQRNTYLWKLNNGIVWVEIPKNGSYNLKQNRFQFDSIQPYESQPNSKIQRIDSIDSEIHKRAFVILRNPIERFKSLVSHYFISGMRVHFGKIWLNNLGIHQWDDSNIMQIVLDNWDKIGNIAEAHHLNSQSSFIPNEFFKIPHMVYNVNEISLMFGLQTGVNSSGSSNVFVSDENLEKIIDIYKDDIELYKKYFDINL
jgi:hypothetical protein